MLSFLLKICLALVLLLTASCYHTYYAPNTLNIPALNKRHDATVGVGYISGIGHSGFEVKSVYSPYPHAALMFNHTDLRKTLESPLSSPRAWSRIRLTEGAIGGYWPYQSGSFSVFTGYGAGSSRHDYGNAAYAQLALRRLFIQPAFAFQNDFLNFGVGIRMIRLNFPYGDVDYRISSSAEGQAEMEIIQRIERDAPFWFSEWGGQLAIRLKPFSLGVYGVLSLNNGGADYHFDGTSIGLNLSVDLHEIR